MKGKRKEYMKKYTMNIPPNMKELSFTLIGAGGNGGDGRTKIQRLIYKMKRKLQKGIYEEKYS